jgi:hypothetical protein
VTALERLDAIDARTAMATGGPWASEARFVGVAIESGSKTVAVVTNLDADAHFMAHARADVPAMATALRATLNLHQPVAQRVGPPICGGCSNDLASVLHPCATVRIIETELTR